MNNKKNYLEQSLCFPRINKLVFYAVTLSQIFKAVWWYTISISPSIYQSKTNLLDSKKESLNWEQET